MGKKGLEFQRLDKLFHLWGADNQVKLVGVKFYSFLPTVFRPHSHTHSVYTQKHTQIILYAEEEIVG